MNTESEGGREEGVKEQQGLLNEQKGNTDLSQHHFQKAPQQQSKSSKKPLFFLIPPSFPSYKTEW